MAEWDDAPLATPQVSTKPIQVTPTSGPAPWDMAPLAGSSAKARATVNANENPEDAGKALSISKQTGIPASIVQTDIPGYDAHAKTQAAAQAVQNPAIASYIDQNPMAAKVSNDDYSVLDKISGVFKGLGQSELDQAVTFDLARQVPGLGNMLGTQPGREKFRGFMDRAAQGFAGGFGEKSEVTRILQEAKDAGLSQNVIDFWQGMGLVPAARAFEGAIRLPGGIIGGLAGLGAGAYEAGFGDVAEADRLQRDLNIFGTGALIESGQVKPMAKPVGDLHTFLAEHTPGGPRDLSAGETPKDQLWQAKPIIDQVKAETASDALDSAVEAAQESKTKERSPELFEEYLKAHGNKGTVHVPAQAILDLYEKAGKVPMDGDGLFGFVPRIADKATLAAETGAEVKIPLSKYIAHVDESVHEGLKDQVRVQENGVTREEAKLAAEEQKAKIEAYHGTPHDFESFDLTKIGTGEGAQVYGHGLYFAEQKAVAQEYQRKFDTSSGAEQDASLYKVHINADPTHFLDWDKPLSEQQAIWDKIAEHDIMGDVKGKIETGEDFYHALAMHLEDINKYEDKSERFGGPGMIMDQANRDASKMLAEAGIPGIKYLDQGSRFHEVNKIKEFIAGEKRSIVEQEALIKAGNSPDSRSAVIESLKKSIEKAEADLKIAENPTRNFVVFDDKLVKIIEKNDNPVVQAAVERTIKERQSLYLEPLFKDAAALNITAPEFKRYSDLIDRSQEQVLTKAVALAKREASKRLTPEWRANEATERAAVEQEIYDSPAFAADRFFNTDKGLLPNGKKILSDFWKPLGEVKADEWAPVFGFESGSAMVKAIIELETERADAGKGPKWQMKQHVDAETAARMEAKYGHLADNIAIEASEAALAEYNVDLLATEWKMLARLNGREPPLAREELTSWAKDQFDKSTVSEVSYETWRRAAEKGGRETEKALLKKDFEEAFTQKQKQMLSFLLAREAKGFEKEVGRAERLFDKYQSEINLPAVDQAYTDQIHRQLQQYGIETKRTVENTDYNLQGKDFDGFVRDKNANGDMIVKAELPRKPVDQFTVDEYRDFATMIKSLDHNGREAMRIEVAGRKEAFNEVIDKIAKNLDTLEKNDFDPTAKGTISRLRAVGRAVDSRLLKAEKLIDWIDKKDPLGAFNSSVLRGLIEGEQGKGDMITKLAKMAGELPGDRAWGKALNDATTNHELLDLMGKPMQLSNENKIAIALNYGNKSNRKILLEGYKWKEHEVEAYLAREMTDMDKAVVDGIHGLFEPLAPLVEKATSSRAGVAIPLIEGSPHNGMRGGYYPLMEDPRSKLLGQQVDTDLFQKTKFDPLPTANALKQRTGKVYPLDLSISQIHARLSQTAHAVFMQDPVINANKVISDPIVREGIDKAFGPEYVKMLDKWIRDIADNGGSDVGFHDDAATWLSRNLRQNVTVQLMGWKASTALIHGGSAGASSIYELGKMDMDTTGNATKSFVTSPARLVQEISRLGLGQFLPNAARRFFGSQSNIFDAVDFVQQNSGEMRNRQRSLQKDFGFQLDKIYNQSTWDDAAKLRAIHQTYSMSMVAYLDQLTATPVWKAAYDKATVADGMEHADAVYVADKAVREAHGSASLVSRANIGRGEINKWLTIAYNGYWNHNYNKMREAGKEVAGYDDSLSNGQRVAIGAAFVTAMIVAPALVHHAVRGEEAKTPGGAIAGMLVSQFGGTVPLVNTLTYSMIHNRDPSISPLDEVLKAMSNVVKDRMAANPKHTIKHEAQAFGYLTGLPPTNQAIDTFSFMNDVTQRQQDPKTVQEWARGLMTGHAKPKAK